MIFTPRSPYSQRLRHPPRSKFNTLHVPLPAAGCPAIAPAAWRFRRCACTPRSPWWSVAHHCAVPSSRPRRHPSSAQMILLAPSSFTDSPLTPAQRISCSSLIPKPPCKYIPNTQSLLSQLHFPKPPFTTSLTQSHHSHHYDPLMRIPSVAPFQTPPLTP